MHKLCFRIPMPTGMKSLTIFKFKCMHEKAIFSDPDAHEVFDDIQVHKKKMHKLHCDVPIT